MRAWATLVALLVATAAAGDTLRSVQDAITVAWNPSEDAGVGYVVYVGTESGTYGETYDVGDALLFTFSAGVPGQRYYFAVAAYNAADRVESVLSDEVSAIFGDLPPHVEVMRRCESGITVDCGNGRLLAANLGPVNDLTGLGGGRLLIIENDRDIRVIGDPGLLLTPAVRAVDGERFTQLAIDPAFDRTGYVFVGAAQPSGDGSTEFQVLRYRAVQDTLGERAAVVTGLYFRGEHHPRFALDHERRIYVAMPARDTADADLYDGRILRFNADGSAASAGVTGFPVVAPGFAIPHALQWDGEGLWMSGASQFAHRTARLSFDRPQGSPGAQTIRQTDVALLASFDVMTLDVRAVDDAADAPKWVVFIDRNNHLRRLMTRGHEMVRPVETVAWSRDEEPVDVMVDSAGSLFVVVKSRGRSFGIVKLTSAP